jgi:Holliday junction DNA helicase RuvA
MIALIEGSLVHRSPEYVVVDVGGVGYRLIIPLSTFYKLPGEGERAKLHTCTCVREDAFHLYGFMTMEEKSLFEKLIGVSKIGPRQGINLLSGLPAGELKTAIAGGDVLKLSSIPGVGMKTAERLVLELRDKLALEEGREGGPAGLSLTGKESQTMADVLSALVNLGYRKKEAEKVVKEVWEDGERNIESLLRESLSRLSA